MRSGANNSLAVDHAGLTWGHLVHAVAQVATAHDSAIPRTGLIAFLIVHSTILAVRAATPALVTVLQAGKSSA